MGKSHKTLVTLTHALTQYFTQDGNIKNISSHFPHKNILTSSKYFGTFQGKSQIPWFTKVTTPENLKPPEVIYRSE